MGWTCGAGFLVPVGLSSLANVAVFRYFMALDIHHHDPGSRRAAPSPSELIISISKNSCQELFLRQEKLFFPLSKNNLTGWTSIIYHASMKLITWLKQRKIRKSVFARQIKVSPSTICEFLRGNRKMSPVTAKKIVKATGGIVRLEDLL